MEHLKKLIQKMVGANPIAAKYINATEEEIKTLDPEKDGAELMDAIKLVHRNEIEPELNKNYKASAHKQVYETVENLIMQKTGLTREQVGADAKFEQIFEKAMEAHEAQVIAKTAPADPKKKADADKAVTDLQLELQALKTWKEVEYPKELQAEKDKIKSFETGLRKKSTLEKVLAEIAKEKDLIIGQPQAFKLINDDIEGQYTLIEENGNWEPRNKENTAIKIPNASAGFKNLKDIMTEALEKQELFAKSKATSTTTTSTTSIGTEPKKGFVLSKTALESEAAAEKVN